MNKQLLEIKIIYLFVMLKKVKKSFMECEKNIGSMEKGIFKHLFNSRWFLTSFMFVGTFNLRINVWSINFSYSCRIQLPWDIELRGFRLIRKSSKDLDQYLILRFTSGFPWNHFFTCRVLVTLLYHNFNTYFSRDGI